MSNSKDNKTGKDHPNWPSKQPGKKSGGNRDNNPPKKQ
jgi:hypothetical protein